MSKKIVQLNEKVIKRQHKELVQGGVEKTLIYRDFPNKH